MSVSPLETLLVEELTLMTSADSRFPAISKEVRVRVEASKKRLIMVFPRKRGNFFYGTGRNFLQSLGGIQNLQDLFAVKVLDSEQIFSFHVFSIT